MNDKIDINVSVSKALLDRATKVLEEFGVSLGNTINGYLFMIAKRNSTPFVYFENGPVIFAAQHAKISAQGRIIPPDSWWDEDDFDDEC